MKFEIKNRWSGAVQFTAEIECDAGASFSVKLGLAVKAAVSAGANLAGANLAGAYLAGAYLAGANLAGANLADANLAGANLADANLADANLAGAYLAGAVGGGEYIRCLTTERWTATWTADVMQIGCQRHEIARWFEFSDRQIEAMDPYALEWWGRWKPVIQAAIAAHPCKTTRAEAPSQPEGGL